ncbi:MAG: methyltransferase family protein [Rhizobiaceae bacterium]
MSFAFVSGIAFAILLILVALWSIIFPQRSIWPPARRSLLIEIGIWPATVMIFWSAASVGLADWNSLEWSTSFRWGIGLPMMLVANLLVSVGMWQLGLANTSGIPVGLVTTGLYRLSRNPQYLGNSIALAGWFILSASVLTLPAVLLGVVMFMLATEAEDRWMAIKFGGDFYRWKDVTPRLLFR